MRYSIRYAVVNSQITLPVACVIGSMFWLFGDITHWSRWTGWVVTMVTTVAVMEWNHRATLIRQRNRMASTTFIVLMTIAAFLQNWSPAMLATLCFVIANIILCYTFQSRKSQGLAYHAFVVLGIGSLFFPPLLYIIPFMIFSMGIQLRSLTWRSFVAALLGVLTPYWLCFVWHFCMSTTEGAFDFFLAAMAPRGISYAGLTHKEVIADTHVYLHYFHTECGTIADDNLLATSFRWLYAALHCSECTHHRASPYSLARHVG